MRSSSTKVYGSDEASYGFDAAAEQYGNMIQLGIIDPTKVCRSALENASSVASMVLTTESLVTDIPTPPAPVAAPPAATWACTKPTPNLIAEL